MFTIETDADSGEHVLVAADGEKISVRDDVWQRLRDPNEIFSNWKSLLQKWSIHLDKAPVLKQECPTDADYRSLRTVIRTHTD